MKAEILERAKPAFLHPVDRVYPVADTQGHLVPEDWEKAFTGEGFFAQGTLEPEGARPVFRMLRDEERLHVRVESASRGANGDKESIEFYVTQAGRPDFPLVAVVMKEDGTGIVGLARRAQSWWGHPAVFPLEETVIPRKVSPTEKGWMLEFSLPFEELDLPRDGFRFNVVHDPGNGERFAWCDLGGWTGASNQFDVYARAVSAEENGSSKNGLRLPAQLSVGLNRLSMETADPDVRLKVGDEALKPKDGFFELIVRERGPLDMRLTARNGNVLATYHADIRRPFLISALERFVHAGAREFELDVVLDISGDVTADIVFSCQRGDAPAEKHKASLESGQHSIRLPVPAGDGANVRVSAEALIPISGAEPLVLNALHWFAVGVDEKGVDAYREDIRTLPTDRLCWAILADAVPGLLLGQEGDGRYCRPERSDRWNRLWPQMCVYVPALLYKTKHPDNSFFGDKRLLDSAVLGMEYALRPEIRMEEYGCPDSRSPQAFLLTYDLLKDEIEPGRRAYWQEELEHVAEAEAGIFLRRIVDRYTFYSRDCGTSTNHMAYHVANVDLAGRLFGREDWQELGEMLMRRLARHGQDGYFEEQRGSPVNHYTWLTASSLGEYHRFSGDAEVLPTLRACARYMTAITTAQGGTMALHDSRNSQHEHYPVGDFLLSLLPEGRQAARARALATMGDRPSCIRRETLFRMAENARDFEAGPEPDLFGADSEHPFPYGIIVRKKGFQYGLSNISRAAVLGNFRLDGQNLIEMFHKDAGCILHGGNSQSQPEAGSFFRKLDEPDWPGKTAATSNDYLPDVATVMRIHGGHKVMAEYRTFKANVAVQVISPTQARVEVYTGSGNGPVTFNFFPGAEEGEEVVVDPDGKTLRFRHVMLRANRAFQVQHDFRVLNPYNMTYTYTHKPVRCWLDLNSNEGFIVDIHVASG